MARISPVSLLVLFLICVIIFLSIDLHGKSFQLLRRTDEDEKSSSTSQKSQLLDQKAVPFNECIIYNRIPKTASTAFTHVLYDLAKVNELIKFS